MARDLRAAFAAQARMARERAIDRMQGDARAAQAAVLAECLAPNADTAFGDEHGFAAICGSSGADIDAYRARVPVRDYDGLEPWIERAAAGEPGVLTREDPIRFWKTTGTTSKSKKIPVTPAANARFAESFMALQGTQLAVLPALGARADAMLLAHLSPRPVKETLAGRFPFCTTTEVPIEVRPGHEEFLSPWLAPLQRVVEDDAERLYFLLTFAALHDIIGFGCLHPSRFQTVLAVLDQQWPRLVRELHDGTLLGVPARDPRPDVAARLEVAARERGTLRPRDLWPHLQLATSWSGSYARRYRPIIDAEFSTRFLAMPSISSECFMTLTIDEDPLAQPLNLRGGVFEFVPEGEVPEAGAATLLPHELEEGRSYEIVLTTLGGLYRYAMCDIFRVTGFVGRTPRLEYLGRRSVSDLTGEKLAEAQAADVIREAFAARGIEGVSCTMCAVQADAESGIVSASPAGHGRRPRYVLVLETAPHLAARIDLIAGLGDELDARVKAINSRYAMKRSFLDLDPLAVEVVPTGTFAAYRALLVRRGMPAGQLKDKVLHPDGGPVLADLLSCRG